MEKRVFYIYLQGGLTSQRRFFSSTWVILATLFIAIGDPGMAYLPDLFERAAELRPSSPAVIEDTGRCTFGELRNEVSQLANLLKERVKGDTVGVLLLNSQRYVVTMSRRESAIRTTRQTRPIRDSAGRCLRTRRYRPKRYFCP